MIKTLKTGPGGQQPREPTSEVSSWESFHLLSLFISNSSLHLSSRAVASINKSLLHSNRRLLMIEIQKPFVQQCANKPLRVISTPLLLWFSFAELQKRRLHPLPIGAPTPFKVRPWLIVGCVGWFFESVVGRILDSGCRLKTVVGFEFYLPGCTSYRCLQQVIRLFYN